MLAMYHWCGSALDPRFLGRAKPGKRSVNVRDWNAVSKMLSGNSREHV